MDTLYANSIKQKRDCMSAKTDDRERLLLYALRIFGPRDERLSFGHGYWRICYGIWKLMGKNFNLDDLQTIVNRDSTFRNETLSFHEISAVVNELDKNGFFRVDATGTSSKQVLPEAADVLNEFFGFGVKPKTGKIGFARYLNKSEKRVMLWYCLHESEGNRLHAREAARITGYPQKKCGSYLEQFASRKWLSRRREGTYSLIDKKAVFQELFSRYNDYCLGLPSMRNYIMFVLLHHEKVSGKMIREDLEEEEISCDPKTVYNHMKTLEREGVLIPTREFRKVRGAHEEFFKVNFTNPDEYCNGLTSRIGKRMQRSGVHIGDEFFKVARMSRPGVLQVFWEGLRWGFVLRSPDDASTIPLWLNFLENLQPETLSRVLSEISRINAGQDVVEKLKGISKKYRTSSLVTLIMYYSLWAAKGNFAEYDQRHF
jgi:hypothetical protein